jgi:transcriptional/translational regulatory protein YebC/TACO1
MAGHSNWKKIKRMKAITDAKRASSWTKVIREITVAARSGGALQRAGAQHHPHDHR